MTEELTPQQELENIKNNLANIVHDTKNPLAVIAQNANILLRYTQLNEDKKVHYLQAIQRNADFLLNLVEDLDFQRLKSGQLQLQFAPLDVVDLTRQVVNNLNSLAEQKSLGLTFDTSDQTLIINGDKNHLTRAINNLVNNAIKYTADGQVRVILSRRRHKAFLYISDTGMGLSEEQLGKLFERFYRADSARHIPGTGLGLAITKEIIKLHQGEIKVTSTVGKGSTFTVCLPLAMESQSEF